MAYLLLFSKNMFFEVPDGKAMQWLGIVAYSTLFMPLLVIFLLWRLKFVQSLEMETARERYVPLIACMSFYFWVFWIFHSSLQAPAWMQMFLLASFISMVLSFLLTIFGKISLHMTGITAVMVYAFLLNVRTGFQDYWFLIFAILLTAVLWAARKYLKAHNKQQLIAGAAAGAFSGIIAFLFY